MYSMASGLVKGSCSQDYNIISEGILLCLVYELQGYPLIQWFLMYANIGKLICYTSQ